MCVAAIAAAAAGTVLIAIATASPGKAAQSACKPGLQSVLGGHSVRVFCGPGTAAVREHGRTFAFANGTCISTARGMEITLGTLWLDPTPPKFRFFFLGALAKRDGRASKSQIEWHAAGKRRLLFDAKVLLMADRTRGTFRGKLEDGSIATGSFRC